MKRLISTSFPGRAHTSSVILTMLFHSITFQSFESDKRSVSSPTSSLHNTRRSISTRNNQRRLQRSQHDIRNRHSTADSINVTGRQIHGSNHGSSPARGREDLSGRKTSLRRPRQRQSRSSPDTHVKGKYTDLSNRYNDNTELIQNLIIIK